MRHVMTVTCSLLCLASALATAAEVDYGKAVDEAVRAGKVADVNRLCVEWAKDEPGNEKPRIVLGQTLLKVGMVDRALEQFELAAEANPLSPVPRCETGGVFLNGGRLEAAAREFGEALRLDPTYTPAAVGRARIALRRGDAKAALATARLAEQSDSTGVLVRVLLGDCLLALGECEDGLAEYRRAIELDREDPDAAFGLAKACETVGKEEEARQQWERFLQIEPSGKRADAVRNGWVVLDTRSACKVEDPMGHGVAWSPDGRYIAFGRSVRTLAAVILDREQPTIQDIAVVPGQFCTHPTWSPDGKYLAILEKDAEGSYFVAVVSTDGSGEPKRVGTGYGVTWSPDHGHLLYTNAYGRAWGFRSLTIDGKMSERHLLLDSIRSDGGRKWRAVQSDFGPSGRRVACAASGGRGVYEIFMRDVSRPGKPTQLTHEGVNNCAPDFAPDGRSVAYTSNARGNHDIWVVAADGSAGPTVLVELGMRSLFCHPDWSPDSRALAYRTRKSVNVVRLGGLSGRPVDIATKGRGEALSVVVKGQAQTAQQVSLRWEAFDVDSLRIALGEAEDGPLDVKPKEKAEWTIKLDPDVADKAQTVKITALNEDGRGAVKLVDWQE